MPQGCAPLTWASTWDLTSFITSSRSEDSSSRTVRLLTSWLKALRTTLLRRLAPVASSSPTLRMYWVGSVMRQRTYQSITTGCRSAVSTGVVSLPSRLSSRLSM